MVDASHPTFISSLFILFRWNKLHLFTLSLFFVALAQTNHEKMVSFFRLLLPFLSHTFHLLCLKHVYFLSHIKSHHSFILFLLQFRLNFFFALSLLIAIFQLLQLLYHVSVVFGYTFWWRWAAQFFVHSLLFFFCCALYIDIMLRSELYENLLYFRQFFFFHCNRMMEKEQRCITWGLAKDCSWDANRNAYDSNSKCVYRNCGFILNFWSLWEVFAKKIFHQLTTNLIKNLVIELRIISGHTLTLRYCLNSQQKLL